MRLLLTTALLVAPWVYLPSHGPTPQVERWLLSAMAAAGTLLWVPLLPKPQRARTLAQLLCLSLLSAALLSTVAAAIQYFGWSQAWQPLISATNEGTAHANLLQRNQFATLTVLGLAALLYLVDCPRGKACSTAALSAAALLGAGNALASSRIGLVELVALIALVWRRPAADPASSYSLLKAAATGYALVSGGVELVGFGGGIVGRFLEHAPCASRLVLWDNVLYLISQKPWAGWGIGELGYAHFLTLYPGARFCDIVDNAHNLPLHVAVEFGVPLASVACAVLLWWILSVRPWREPNLQRQLAFALLLALGLHSMVEYPLWYGPFQLSFAIALWILWETRTYTSIPMDTGCQHLLNAWVARLTSCVLLVAASYVAWDYWRVSQIYLPSDARAAGYREDTLLKIQSSSLFRNQVRFAELSITEVSPENAERTFALATDMLHFSSEPMVVEKLLESALLLRRSDDLAFYLERYRHAFPTQHALWVARNASRLPSG
ncbi:MAG: O-antigen ligase C-terminal domain-containing protein [Rhodoferax sp.]|nr:O-antigen ligase C-terminal domain-containing protein [Rhodoferax sp.]